MKQPWWGDFNHPLVNWATGVAVSLFLAFNFPKVFLAIVGAALCYAAGLVGVSYVYRNRYAIVGKSELAARFVRKTFSGFREGCSQMVVHALEEHERRKLLKRERQERLRRCERERNRRKREQARRALA